MSGDSEQKPLLGGGGSSLSESEAKYLVNLDNLASAQYRNGKYAEAEDLLRKAYVKRKAVLSETHVDTLLNLNNLAASLGRLGRLKEAEECFRGALEGRESLKGKTHADTLTTVNHLGVLLKQQGQLDEAEKLLARALEGFTAVLGAEHVCTAEAAYNYAVLCVQKGRRHKAVGMFASAHTGLKKSLGAEHQHTLDALHWEIKCRDSVPPDALESQEGNVFQSKDSWKKSPLCEVCQVAFTLMRREHHCRVCSRSVCNDCSLGKSLVLEFDAKTFVRICSICEQQGF
jgi:tetratricopeptide (TPR) repeat protein